MNSALLVEADRIVNTLSAARREAVRELVINATRRGCLDEDARRFLDRISGGTLLGAVLAEAIADAAREASQRDDLPAQRALS